uniref:LanC like glutathione S-transferase 1 n=1 Tax=Ornithorhynchus anatinus TaxID=9258 RepID=A0A6I8N431_ORNAN
GGAVASLLRTLPIQCSGAERPSRRWGRTIGPQRGRRLDRGRCGGGGVSRPAGGRAGGRARAPIGPGAAPEVPVPRGTAVPGRLRGLRGLRGVMAQRALPNPYADYNKSLAAAFFDAAGRLTPEFSQRLNNKIRDLLQQMERGLKSADPRDCTVYTGWAANRRKSDGE